jgi:sulfatase maturation enzyme AslB (radical SAM superfamily)
MGIFYHTDGARVCCTSKKFIKSSPADFRSSDMIVELKQEFLAGNTPDDCSNCWDFEKEGFVSLRNSIFYNESEYADYQTYTVDTDPPDQYMELRTSNLCNFSCRMCNPLDSNRLGREIKSNPHLNKYYHGMNSTHDLVEMSDEYFDQVLDQLKNVKRLMFTGGEPMIMKRYYDLLDYAIAKGYNKNIVLSFHTNGSVYNPQITERLVQFSTVRIIVSIDGTDSVAEYQRYGTDWPVVAKNTQSFLNLPNVYPSTNTALSAYNILKLTDLTRFLLSLTKIDNRVSCIPRIVQWPAAMTIDCLNNDLRKIAVDQIIQSIELVSDNQNLANFANECKMCLTELEKPFDPVKYNNFVEFTKDLDFARNQSFEDVFNYKLY